MTHEIQIGDTLELTADSDHGMLDGELEVTAQRIDDHGRIYLESEDGQEFAFIEMVETMTETTPYVAQIRMKGSTQVVATVEKIEVQ